MNNIHAKDWEEDDWGVYSGIGSTSEWYDEYADKELTKNDKNNADEMGKS